MTVGKLLSEARDLKRRRGRERRGRFVAEGIRTVEALLASRLAVRGAVVAPTLAAGARGAALERTLRERGVPVLTVDDVTLAEAADTESPQGVLAIAEVPALTLEALPAPGAWLVLDGVQDPGNVGTLVRTAHALGATATVALPGTADLWNAKVVRGAMGSLFVHPVVHAPWDAVLDRLRAAGASVVVADAGGVPVQGAAAAPPCFGLVVGNEGAGVAGERLAVADRILSIPMAAGAESLNVAVATGILLHALTQPRAPSSAR